MTISEEVLKQYKACREDVAVAIVDDWKLLRLKGEDHLTFLQGQTTNDVLALEDGQGHAAAILDPKAKVISLIYNFRCKDCLYMLVPSERQQAVAEHLEKYAVMDEVEVSQPDFGVLSFSGPNTRKYLEGIFSQELKPHALFEHQQLDWNGTGIPLLEYSFTGENGFLIFAQDVNKLLAKIDADNSLIKLSSEAQEILRIEAGLPKWGSDCSESTLFPEMNLQTGTVSYTKGCFVGQEIVARVKYRGAVNKCLMGMIFDEDSPEESSDFRVRGQKGGVITSISYSPSLEKNIALAFINKKHRAPGTRLNVEVEEKSFKATTSLLPFYQLKSEIDEAEGLYYSAMDLFKESSDEDDIKAEPILREAIRKNPKMADAYETLGVILSRHERYDEAIALMKQLKEINPEEVMAYSNLSLYYMKKGMIDEAEAEKAAATTVTFKIAAKERKQRLEVEKLEKEKAAEAKRRMGMFQQVLEIDSDDLIANFGLGKALLDAGESKDAIPYLEKCLSVKKDYTAAFLHLGQALMKSGNQAQAKEIFKNGIECANISGDMMPGNEMERLLAGLNSSLE
ncbi:MAG: tetratricopeptide repeat protein [Lentisphaerales bacterium]|nr:tetratricopeptide repeat protein [Lentisphaerales bacterium]